jgi:hypothetical protein
MLEDVRLEISLSPEGETRLRERAAAAGKQPADLAGSIVEREVRRPTLEEISGSAYQSFLESGMTDDQLGDMLEAAKHKMRAEQRNGDTE